MPPTTCTCATAALTTVRFTHGVVLQRCVRHEQQSWTVEGRPATSARAHDVLRDVFVEGRTRRSGSRAAAPRQVVELPQPSTAPATTAPATTAQALTALLNARGLEGSWAVA